MNLNRGTERKEVKITAALSEKLDQRGAGVFIVKNELGLRGGIGGASRKDPALDIAFGRENGTSGKKPLMAFCEAGFLKNGMSQPLRLERIDKLFWEKMHQSLSYLDLLIQNNLKLNDDRFTYEDDPLLLGVLVASREMDLGRLAVFICEPKKGNNENSYWRVALLWRKEMYSEEDISTAFGGFVASVRYLAQEGPRLEMDGGIWHYMGPNCCKVSLNGNEEVRACVYICCLRKLDCVFAALAT